MLQFAALLFYQRFDQKKKSFIRADSRNLAAYVDWLSRDQVRHPLASPWIPHDSYNLLPFFIFGNNFFIFGNK